MQKLIAQLLSSLNIPKRVLHPIYLNLVVGCDGDEERCTIDQNGMHRFHVLVGGYCVLLVRGARKSDV